MASLVADYSGDSEESDSDTNSNESDSRSPSPSPPTEDPPCDASAKRNVENVVKLPKPNFETATSKNSVFKNPFVEEENAKKAILEKHVKMVPTKDKALTINGRKICWNYRKGRCRFGHTCTFAHDSDLHNVNDLNSKQNTTSPAPDENASNDSSSNSKDATKEDKMKRKRPGLGNSVIPSKKVLKIYKRQKKTK